MARAIKLSPDELEELRAVARGVTKPCFSAYTALSRLGLVDIKHSRFGEYVVLTEAGRQHLSRTESQQVVGLPAPRGPGDTGHSKTRPEAAAGGARTDSPRAASLRGAVPRPRRNTAKQPERNHRA